MTADYRVDLPVFHGPLDLLLFLIKRDELDITDIPIHSITQSYLGYLEQLRKSPSGFDINTAGDFVVMAATLMEIKSAMLLPEPPAVTKDGATTAAQDLADPRQELVQQLLEYKRLKDNANLLERQQSDYFNRFARVPASLDGDDEPPPLDLDEIQIYDLLAAFTRLMKDTGGRGPRMHEVVYDETPIALHAADIEDRLRREKSVSLRTLLIGRTSKSEMIGVFLALLELVREKRVLVSQEEAGDDLILTDAPPEHRRTFIGASLDLSNHAAELPGSSG
ncbi:MAG TPA: segregation/condensation protein A [Tepidisphaeraceae bacterium]|jgi:segregation and condensation protein A